MNQFQRFDISDFFDQMQAPLFLIDDDEIIFFNRFFKENFELPKDDWKRLFSSSYKLEKIQNFFATGEPIKEKIVQKIKSTKGIDITYSWEFTNLPSGYGEKFLVVKGDRKEVIPEKPSLFSPSESSELSQDEVQYLRTILNNTHDLIAILDVEGKYTYISPSVGEKLGFSVNDIIGRNFREFLGLGVLELVKGNYTDVFKTDKEVNIDFWIKKSSGERMYIESFAKNLLDDPYINGILFSARDITEFVETKEDLRKSEEKYRSLVEESTEIIFSLSETFHLIYVSPNLNQFLGYESEEVIGNSIFDYLDPEDLDVFQGMIGEDEDFLAQNQFLEFKLRHKDGTYRVFNSNGKMIQSKEGNQRYYTGVARDISKLKDAQIALLKAKENAEYLSLVKSQFLSIMSHEIRTPMNVVIGMSHFLMKEDPRPDQLENLKTLQFSAENLLALINDILDFSKIESGKIELEKVSFDIRNLINRLTHSHSFQADEKSLELTCEVEESIPDFLMGDPVRLSQILNNLMSNAIKFTEKGKVNLYLKSLEKSGNRCKILFSMVDTGIGIPQEKLPNHIFEAFTQASPDTTRKYGGTGLGLAIVKRLIELFDSEIKVNSKEGEGTSFYFEIDFEVQEELDLEMTKISLNQPKSLQEAFILVAEDNMVNQILLKKFLTKWNTGNLVLSSDGQKAIDEFEKGDFNLILLDLQMPVLDGFSVARFIRNHPDEKKRNTPILVLTATSIHEIRDQMDEIGINGFIPKPFTPEVLYEKLVSYLNPKDS